MTDNSNITDESPTTNESHITNESTTTKITELGDISKLLAKTKQYDLDLENILSQNTMSQNDWLKLVVEKVNEMVATRLYQTIQIIIPVNYDYNECLKHMNSIYSCIYTGEWRRSMTLRFCRSVINA